MRNYLLCSLMFVAHLAVMPTAAAGGEETKIVGSSTVSKFAHVANRRLKQDGWKIVIETTGTSGGVSLFCTSGDPEFAPVVLASRAMHDSEKETCAQYGIGDIRQYDLGLSGVVFAKKRAGKMPALTRKDLFLALAAQTPIDESNCTLVANPRQTWRDVRKDLPNWPIEVFGPPATSGTRASFIDLAMREGAKEIDCMRDMHSRDRNAFNAAISSLRMDGPWIDAGENDSVIFSAISRIPYAFGILGYPQYVIHEQHIAAVTIDAVTPSRDTIADGSYSLSRTLRVYANGDALETNPAARAFVEELTGQSAIGHSGYLLEEGLVSPFPAP